MNDTATLTSIDLIHAHQATLSWLASNSATYHLPLGMTTHTVAEADHAYLTPDTPAGRTLLLMIANAMGKPVTSDNVIEIALYLRGC